MKLCECGCGLEVTREGNRFLNGHWIRVNHTMSNPESVKKLSETLLVSWQDPEFIKMMSKSQLGISKSEEHKKNLRDAQNRPEVKRRQRDVRLGEKHWNWLGGISFFPYPPEFNDVLKVRIRERDNYICQKCGRTEVECLFLWNQNLHVHHIDYDKENLPDENLISLCNSCNSEVNTNREYWTKFFQKIIEETQKVRCIHPPGA